MNTREKQRMAHATQAFARLVEIIDTLRAPGGCPWDRKQTRKTLLPYIVEEAYELIDAIEAEDAAAQREELGDLLLQIVLQAQIAFEEGQFHIGDVVAGLSEKMVYRHPHVFGQTEVDGVDEVLSNWEKLKGAEKKDRGMLDGVPRGLPALLKAYRMGQKVGRVGFDWPQIDGVRAKVDEELGELEEAMAGGDKVQIEHELGDLLFSLAQLGRHLGVEPEVALQRTCDRFAGRFAHVEKTVKADPQGFEGRSLEELEALWQAAKAQERAQNG